MKSTAMQKIALGLLVSLAGILIFGRVASAMERPATRIFHSYRTVVTDTLQLPQSQTIYLSYTMTYNGYFKIKKPDNTIVLEVNRSSTPPESIYLPAGTYTVITYGGDGMAYGHSVNDTGVTVEVTYINQPTGKLIRIVEGTGTFTTQMTTTIYYDWSGGVKVPSHTLGLNYNPAYLQISGPTPVAEGPYAKPNGSFTGKPGTYSVALSGGNFTPQAHSTIYVTGKVDIWYDDTQPGISITSSKKDQWVKGDSDFSAKVDFNIAVTSSVPNLVAPLLVKVFTGPDGQTASLYQSYPYNPAAPIGITGAWPVPADADGLYQAYAELWENNGTNLKLRTSSKINFKIDNTPPALNVTKSPDQSYYSSGKTPELTFNYTANDTGSGLKSVTIYVDGIPQQSNTGTGSQNGVYSWTVPGLDRHTITFIAADAVGNQTGQTFSIDIDNTPPQFSGDLQIIPAPIYLSYVNSSIISYTWMPVNETHLQEYKIKIEAAALSNPTNWTTALDWTSTGQAANYSFTVPAEYNGWMLKATVKAVDLVGMKQVFPKPSSATSPSPV